MPDFNEEDYLDNLLKGMDGKVEESEDDKQEGIIEEKDKEAVDETNAEIIDQILDNSDSKQENEVNRITEENIIDDMQSANKAIEVDPDEVASKVIAEESDSEELDSETQNLDDETQNLDSETQNLDSETQNLDDETQNLDSETQELDDDMKELFEPEDESFDMNNIPDREPAELTQSEIDRLASMELDNLLEDVTNNSVSVENLFSEGKSKDDNDSEEKDSDNFKSDNEDATENELDHDGLNEAAMVAAVASAAMSNDKNASDKSHKKSKHRKKFSITKFIKNIFFENLEEDIEPDDAELETPIDENQMVIQEIYGAKGEGELLDDDDEIEVPKKGFFAKFKYKLSNHKKKAAEEDRAEQEAEDIEYEEKQRVKAEKKEISKNKKEEAKKAKADKPKKQKKPKKVKKEKPPKEPSKPGDILKIKPVSLIFLLAFVAGIVILLETWNTWFFYNNDVSQAKLYFQNSNYEKAYSQLQGNNLKGSDKEMYNQVRVIMYVESQYLSYQNYVKLGMGTEALDSLIKGLDRYDTYYVEAKELGVTNQIDAVKKQIVDELQSKFKLTEDKAKTYVNLSKSDFTQYYYTIEGYGGMINDSNN